MGEITSLFLHKVLAQVSDGLDKPALMRSAGIAPDAPVDPKRMVRDEDYYALLERIARDDPAALDLPLRVGASMRCDEYGAFGLAFKSALNLLGSYARAQRYARVLTSVTTYTVEESEQGVWMALHRDGDRRLGLRLSNEASIASVAAISAEVTTARFRPLAVYFRHRCPGTTLAHERHFGCPVYFASQRDALLLAHDLVRQPNRLGDRSISGFFDSHLEEELAGFDDEAALEQQVCSQVARALSQGVPRITDVAGWLGMSGRTLQRRLASRGHSFQSLVDDARRELAERLLRDTEYPLAEVAFLTGFSEQSAFTRAFGRWVGKTPRAYRLQAR
jgi:AraC-like DNA-binding protein